MKSKSLPLWAALLLVLILIILLSYNVFVFKDDSLSGSNQFILLFGATIAAVIGFIYKVPYKHMLSKVADNFKSVTTPVLILFLVGALAGTWLLSGIIPAMIYYGLQILHPSIFLPACLIICCVISLSTGSSWTTSATIGIAMIGIGKALGVSAGMTAGAVLSGAYFGDKLSPISDTTNLAPAVAGTDLFTHIRYLTYTTIPSISIALVVFLILSLGMTSGSTQGVAELLSVTSEKFTINGWLFIVPAVVIYLIVKKSPPLIALLIGIFLAIIAALIFQRPLLIELSNQSVLNFNSGYQVIVDSIVSTTQIETGNERYSDLFSAGGMSGMLNTIWLIICAMAFGGVLDAIGALSVISGALLRWAKNTFQLFLSTVASTLAVNISASDQYLAIIVPGKMFNKAYRDRNLAPENLSRTLEDAGTVTSVLIPWNTCGAYQSGVLGVSVADYFIYAIFNWVSPLVTLVFALFRIKIRQLVSPQKNIPQPNYQIPV